MDRITAPRRRRPAGTRTTRKPAGQGREAWSRSIRRVPGSGSRGALGAGGGGGAYEGHLSPTPQDHPSQLDHDGAAARRRRLFLRSGDSLGLPFPLPGAPVS
ncbi:hypothetical protein PR202_gb09604 [Eleusine coracana subsp. coracana]|uniref:Uncharacterized protein n=1 Tax=Eleusine coracana subsp. coracana TaxID=191504 RepID=A0AAV5EHU5_ELECO|nr:hypothetical protein PR202_gb09604 [Eleusine coracana subsp. coracana]